MPDFWLIFWIALSVVLVVIEAITPQLVTIWIAAGSLVAMISKILGADVWLQWVVFIAVSVIALFITRPIAKKFAARHIQPTNADRYIGKTAVVTEAIDNVEAKGQVKVDGSVWSARSTDGTVFDVGQTVTIEKIDGVKLIVK